MSRAARPLPEDPSASSRPTERGGASTEVGIRAKPRGNEGRRKRCALSDAPAHRAHTTANAEGCDASSKEAPSGTHSAPHPSDERRADRRCRGRPGVQGAARPRLSGPVRVWIRAFGARVHREHPKPGRNRHGAKNQVRATAGRFRRAVEGGAEDDRAQPGGAPMRLICPTIRSRRP